MYPASLTTATLLACCLVAAPSKDEEIIHIDLQAKANAKIKAEGDEGNNLAALGKGKHTLEGVKFDVGEGIVQLGSTHITDKPAKVEGIKVDQKFNTLHILHGTHHAVEDDTIIARYVVHFADDTTEKIEVVYGKDLRDWWTYKDTPKVTRGKVAWEGENDLAKQNEAKIRLYLYTWKNPKPEKKVTSIDLVGADDTGCALFCVGMTLMKK